MTDLQIVFAVLGGFAFMGTLIWFSIERAVKRDTAAYMALPMYRLAPLGSGAWSLQRRCPIRGYAFVAEVKDEAEAKTIIANLARGCVNLEGENHGR